MYCANITVSWEAAHRLMSAYSEECKKNIHGHSYKAHISVGTDALNEDRMVCDFKKFKEIVRKAIKDWDHSIFLHEDDPLWGPINEAGCRIITCSENPTAEAMAKMLVTTIDWQALGINVQMAEVTVWETADNSATYSGVIHVHQ